jgi:hypothetical protein
MTEQATRTCATCHAVLADGPQPAATYEPLSDQAFWLVAECRALIKRIDDLLHDNNAEAAHVDLHELAHKFEQIIGRHA